MGRRGFSTSPQEANPKLETHPSQINAPKIVIPEVTWEVDEKWAEHSEHFRQMAAEGGYDIDADEAFQSTMVMRAKGWLDKLYPECARAGSSKDMGDLAIRTEYGYCRYPVETIVTTDDNGTAVLYAYSIIISASGGEGDERWPLPGEFLNGPDIEGAKTAALEMMATLEQTNGPYLKHVVLRVFIGADLVTAKYNITNTDPSILELNSEPTEEFKKNNKEIRCLESKEQLDLYRAILRPTMFHAALSNLTADYPGCTVWDEGELPFSVDAKEYAHPTRLLVARRFEEDLDEPATADAGGEVDHFKVILPGGEESPVKLLRKSSTSSPKSPGEIVAVSLLVTVAESENWPLVGTYAETPAMQAAVTALTDLVKRWNQEGTVQRCLFQVHMGVDVSRHKLVGEKFDLVELGSTGNPARNFGDLTKTFKITLEKQKKHELFNSESHFQAVKQFVTERRAQYPERYDAFLPQVNQQTATHWLQMNFPDCDVEDMGEFPETTNTIDGQILQVAGTRLVVAKEKGKGKHNVRAAVYAVMSPNGLGWAATERSWLDTKEMKEAEDGLLEVLKKWYGEERIAEDCLAHVMMGMDATIYRFVDGERFEDFDEELVGGIKWG